MTKQWTIIDKVEERTRNLMPSLKEQVTAIGRRSDDLFTKALDDYAEAVGPAIGRKPADIARQLETLRNPPRHHEGVKSNTKGKPQPRKTQSRQGKQAKRAARKRERKARKAGR